MKRKVAYVVFLVTLPCFLFCPQMVKAMTLADEIAGLMEACWDPEKNWFQQYGECKGKSYAPMFRVSGLEQDLNLFKWIPAKGFLQITSNYIELQIQFDDEAINFFEASFAGSSNRMPIALEIDINDVNNSMPELDKVLAWEGDDDLPSELNAKTDTPEFDSGNPYGVIIRSPQNLKSGVIYTFRYFPRDSTSNISTV